MTTATVALDRAQWLVDRRSGICGTDIAAILGLSPYAGPLDVWLEKKGLSEPKEETPQMAWGKKLERVIRERYEEETGFTVIQPGFRVHAVDPVICGTPDGIVSLDGRAGRILEIKTSRTAQGWGEPGTDKIPQHYLLQVAWYMALCDYDRADVAVLISGSDYRVYHIDRDHALERHLIEVATAWWNRHVVGDVAPEIDGSDGAGRYLAYRYPSNTRPIKESTEEINSLLLRLEHARKRADEAAWEKVMLENQIKDYIGDADGVDGLWSRATWRKTADAKKTDWEAVARELLCLAPKRQTDDLIARKTTTKPGSRRFCFYIKENEGDDENE